MTVTSFYNNTSSLILSGLNDWSDPYKLMLCTASTFDATDVNLADVTKTEVSSGNGYTTGGKQLTGLAVSAINTNDASLDADDVDWSITTSAVSANSAILYKNVSPFALIAHIDFGGTRTVLAGNTFSVQWGADGIIKLTVT